MDARIRPVAKKCVVLRLIPILPDYFKTAFYQLLLKVRLWAL
jgi:hypothetical protein